MSPISNASRLADFGTGIGTAGAIIQTDNVNQRVGIGTTNPQAMLQVGTAISMFGSTGIISATEYRGDGSNLTGVAGAAITAYVVSVATTTGNLNVSAAATITGDLTVSDSIAITKDINVGAAATITGVIDANATTDSTSSTTGAITAAGGVGIAKDLFVGDAIDVTKDLKVGAAATITGDVKIDGNSHLTSTSDSTSTSSGALIVDGGVGISKNVYIGAGLSIAGTLTYEDVTSVDSVGLITAKSGVNVSGGQVTIGSGITMGIAGVATFSGTSDIHLHDSVRLNVGDASDLSIYHDGSNSFINDSGTGDLKILSSNFYVNNSADDENMIKAISDGAVELYHNNVKTFETIGTGITIYGPEGGNGSILISADEGDDNADKFGMIVNTSGSFFLQNYSSGSWANNLRAYGGGSVELMYGDGTKKFETTNDGTVTTGISTATGGLSINADNKKLTLGADEDLRVYHSGSTNFIEATTHNIHIDLQSGTENAAKFIQNGAVELYHNGTKTFETTSVGAAITSLAHDGGLTISAGSNNQSTKIDLKSKASGGTEYTGRIEVARGNGDMSFSDGSTTRATFGATGNIMVGFTSTKAGLGVTGGLFEGAWIKAGKLSDNLQIGIATANVFYFTTQESTTATPNIRWDDTYTLGNKMNIGDCVSLTVITTAAAAGYAANWTIDGNSVTEEWIGGSAPSAGGSDGLDIYSFTIIKTSNAGGSGFKVIANVSNAT